MSVRTFVVSVSASPTRVVVEDVRSGRRALADGLGSVGRDIAELLREPAADGLQNADQGARGS